MPGSSDHNMLMGLDLCDEDVFFFNDLPGRVKENNLCFDDF